jgi:hypothetical protein
LAVSQISLPFRIALVALLAMCAVWFTVLRPKPAADAPLPAAPGTTGLAHDVAAAKGAAAASDAANARVQRATGGTAAKSASKPAPKAASKAAPKAAATSSKAAPAVTRAAPAAKAKAKTDADASTPLLRALDRNHAVVLLFWNRHGSDDRAVRRAAQSVDRRHGRVVVKVVPVASVGRYTAITEGVQILEAPTVLVIAPGGKARAIAGLTSTPELNQAVADVLAGVKPAK